MTEKEINVKLTEKEIKRLAKFITLEMYEDNMIAGLHGEERAHDPILLYKLGKSLPEVD